MDSVKTAPTLAVLASQARDYVAEILIDNGEAEHELATLERLALEHAAHVLNAKRPAHPSGSALVDAAYALCASRLYFGVHGEAEKHMLESAARKYATDEWRVRWQSLCDALSVRNALSPDVDTPAQHTAALAKINALTGNTPECERLTMHITEERARTSAAEAECVRLRAEIYKAEQRVRELEATLSALRERSAVAEARAHTLEGQLGHATRALTETRSTVGAVFGTLSTTIALLTKPEAT
jgi:hypothetical protein